MSGIGARLKRIESQVILTEDQRTFERLKRAQYNLFRVSDEALVESIVSALEGKELPEWAEAEFQQPIPVGADKTRIAEAEASAQEIVRGDRGSLQTDAEIVAQMTVAVDRIQKSGNDTMKAYLHRLQSLQPRLSTQGTS